MGLYAGGVRVLSVGASVRAMVVGQRFKSRSKVDTLAREYIYLGRDDSYRDQFYNIKIQEVATGEICHVEPEWFRQRKISEGSPAE